MPKRKSKPVESWSQRYADYERRCVEAAKLPDSKRKQSLVRKLLREHADLLNAGYECAALAVAKPPSAVDDILADIQAILVLSRSKTERSDWQPWLDNGAQGDPPPTTNPELQWLAKRVAWHRNHEPSTEQSIQRQRYQFEYEWKRAHEFNPRKRSDRRDFLETYNNRYPEDSQSDMKAFRNARNWGKKHFAQPTNAR